LRQILAASRPAIPGYSGAGGDEKALVIRRRSLRSAAISSDFCSHSPRNTLPLRPLFVCSGITMT
jgi:hypothetical protein